MNMKRKEEQHTSKRTDKYTDRKTIKTVNNVYRLMDKELLKGKLALT